MSITSALAERLGPAGSVTPSGPAKLGTNSNEAYDLYLKGNYYLNRRRPGLEGAARSFEAAIAADPNFARAYAGLASTVFYASAHARSWTAAELEAMTREAGFTKVRMVRPARLPGGVVVIAKRE